MTTDTLAVILESWSKALQDIGADLYQKAFADKGIAALSLVQFRYFELIARKPGITPGELARIMKVSKPTVANVLAGLARKGLIRRERSDDDGRVLRISLEEGAEEIVEYRRSMYRLMASRIRHVLSRADCAALTRTLEKALDPLGKTGSAGKRSS
jgi:DNA-binding MarR family transcriptional regulator